MSTLAPREGREGPRSRGGARRKGRGAGAPSVSVREAHSRRKVVPPAPPRVSPEATEAPRTGEDEVRRKKLTDCRHFLRGHCQHEEACSFRHKEAVASSRTYCERWLETGSCSADCAKMHPSTATITLTDCHKFLDPNSYCKKIRGHERCCQFRHNEAVRRNRPPPCEKWLYYSCRDVSCPRFHPLDRVAWMKQRGTPSSAAPATDRAVESKFAESKFAEAKFRAPAPAPAPPTPTRVAHPAHAHAGYARMGVGAPNMGSMPSHPGVAGVAGPHHGHGAHRHHTHHGHGHHTHHGHGHHTHHGHAGAYAGPRVPPMASSGFHTSMAYPGPVLSAPASTADAFATMRPMVSPAPRLMTSMPHASLNQWDMADGSPPSSPDSVSKEAAISRFSTPETSPTLPPLMGAGAPVEYSLAHPAAETAAPRSLPARPPKVPTRSVPSVEHDGGWHGLSGSVLFSFTAGTEPARESRTWSAPAPPALRIVRRDGESECTHAGPCGSACLVTSPATPLGTPLGM